MDWENILSISVENLTDGEKDELFNKVTWYDCESEASSREEVIALFKVAQDLLKHKSIQVETLLSELDELAALQGEQEARKLSDSEYSKRSDLDELESKYARLKAKHRKALSSLEKSNGEIKELRKTNKLLEQDRLHLQNELQHTHEGDSTSDLSEVRDQQKELMEQLQQKNTHIAKLLDDIETVERDNIKLREKLNDADVELTDGLEQLKSTTDEVSAFKINISDLRETVSKLSMENEALKRRDQELVEESENREKQIQQYSTEIDIRIEEWKKIIERKNEEIQALRIACQKGEVVAKSSTHSAETSVNDETIQATDLLKKMLNDRDATIVELKSNLQEATDDMVETASAIEKLNKERDTLSRQNDDLIALAKNLKSQLKSAHSRSQDLHASITFTEKASSTKDDELNQLIQQLKNSKKIELSDLVKEIVDSKTISALKEKQLMELVRDVNKLQESTHALSDENAILRSRLGLSDADYVSTKQLKSSHTRKLQASLEKEKTVFEEKEIGYRLEIEDLRKTVGKLSNQLIGLNQDGQDRSLDATTVKLDIPESKYIDKPETDVVKTEKYVKVVEENDALRKGLHEILCSVQDNSTDNMKEIKSETLEKLLLALDAKHISGWYHPAMRLQAEVHTIQGVNQELRDQIKYLKTELDAYKKSEACFAELLESDSNFEDVDKNNSHLIQYIKNQIFNILKSIDSEDKHSSEILEKLEQYKNDFLLIQTKMNVLYNQYSQEKDSWLKDSQDKDKKLNDIEEKLELVENKLAVVMQLTDENASEKSKIEKAMNLSENLVILNRKNVFLTNEQERLMKELYAVREEFIDFQSITNYEPQAFESEPYNESDRDLVLKLQHNLDETLAKYQKLLQDFEMFSEINKNKDDLTETVIDNMRKEKAELSEKLFESTTKLNTFESSYYSVDKSIESLTKKVAQCEVNEINEKHRADHTNNLFELVKEQLYTAEGKLSDQQKILDELQKQNLILQDQLKLAQDKLVNFVDRSFYNALEVKHLTVQEKCTNIANELLLVKSDLKQTKSKVDAVTLWNQMNEYTVLSLKHQIVDLQAITDDKAIIGKLSSDVITARLSEAEMEKKLLYLTDDYKSCQKELEDANNEKVSMTENFHSSVNSLKDKISLLQDIIQNLRKQYYGFVPLMSQDRFVENLKMVSLEKVKILEATKAVQAEQNSLSILREQLNKELENLDEFKSLQKDPKKQKSKLLKWHFERNNLQLQEIKLRRQAEYVEQQFSQAMGHLKEQESYILKLESDLILSMTHSDQEVSLISASHVTAEINSPHSNESTSIASKAVIVKNQDSQTYLEISTSDDKYYESHLNTSLQNELSAAQSELERNEKVTSELRSKVTELELSINLFRTQIGDKQSQITFYEKHILELQSRKDKEKEDIVPENNNQDTLKATIEDLQVATQKKDAELINLQMLLKKDRDEHSLAAARMQEELKRLQSVLATRTTTAIDKTSKDQRQGRAVVEQYILQVHALEQHTMELHTTVTTLSSQLQSAREESVRWRALANDRLGIMEQLSKDLNDQHKAEIGTYKKEADKWRTEVQNLQQSICKYRDVINEMKIDIESRSNEEKDNRIHELSVKLRQQKDDLRKRNVSSAPEKRREQIDVYDQLVKEHETMKRRFEQLMTRERSEREEIRNLKSQLMKRPVLSARSDTSTSNKENQLHQKVKTLKDEISILQDKLQEQTKYIDVHRIRVSEDFEKWNKQKFFQQQADKLKQKLKEKQVDCDKFQEMNSGYKILLDRLEREKHNLEARCKNLKMQCTDTIHKARYDALVLENVKLVEESELLRSKLNVQQHQAGSFGASILQEKLEAQERKIAVLEVSAKGNLETRMELERLTTSLSVAQKTNSRLQAETFDLKLDLERCKEETPHLKREIVELENYIAVLKSESSTSIVGDRRNVRDANTNKVSELERTVVVLKRIVEKLQAENKRLSSSASTSRPCSDRSEQSSERILKRDYHSLQELLAKSSNRIAELEQKLTEALRKYEQFAKVKDELDDARDQLERKTALLDKCKVLLHKAATKERTLVQELAALKSLPNSGSGRSEDAIE